MLAYIFSSAYLKSIRRSHVNITENGSWLGYFKKWKTQKRIITCRILSHREKCSINNSGLKKKLPTLKSFCIWLVPDEDQVLFRKPFLASRHFKTCLISLLITNMTWLSKRKNCKSAEILIKRNTQDKIEYC